jgi:integrase
VRLYDLRHTHCTLLLGAGVPVHVVSQRLGHASAKMTLDVYANYLPDQHEDAVARYQSYLSTARP